MFRLHVHFHSNCTYFRKKGIAQTHFKTPTIEQQRKFRNCPQKGEVPWDGEKLKALPHTPPLDPQDYYLVLNSVKVSLSEMDTKTFYEAHVSDIA